MAASAHPLRFAGRNSAAAPPRHSILVRVTHWITTLSFFGLLISGIAILISHPRLYWGETGNWRTPSLIDLPLPFILGQNGWARYLHFLSGWIAVLTGLVYVGSSLLNRHLRDELWPAQSDLTSDNIVRHLSLRRPDRQKAGSYNPVQRLTYLVVIFVLFPLAIWTGLAMSPAVASVFPVIVTFWGGQQSARTVHFIVSVALVLFFIVHIVKIWAAGFISRTRAMIVGEGVVEEMKT
jgi:thiosulfate reductase cytochrome b subunit